MTAAIRTNEVTYIAKSAFLSEIEGKPALVLQ